MTDKNYNYYKYLINKMFNKDIKDNIKINFSEIALMFGISDMTVSKYYDEFIKKVNLLN